MEKNKSIDLNIWARVYDDTSNCFPRPVCVVYIGKFKYWGDAIASAFSQLGLRTDDIVKGPLEDSNDADKDGHICRYFAAFESDQDDLDDQYMAIDIINMNENGPSIEMLTSPLAPLDSESITVGKLKDFPNRYLIYHIDTLKPFDEDEEDEKAPQENGKVPIINIDALVKGVTKVLGHPIEKDEVMGILKCFGFEVDGKFVPIIKMDGEEQVGMSPAEFNKKFSDLLIPDPDDVIKDDNKDDDHAYNCSNKRCNL